MEFLTERILIEVDLDSYGDSETLVRAASRDVNILLNRLAEDRPLWAAMTIMLKYSPGQSRIRFIVEPCPNKKAKLKIFISLKEYFTPVARVKDLNQVEYNNLKRTLSVFGVKGESLRIISVDGDPECCVIWEEARFRKAARALAEEASTITITSNTGFLLSAREGFNATLYSRDAGVTPIFAESLDCFREILANPSFRFETTEKDPYEQKQPMLRLRN